MEKILISQNDAIGQRQYWHEDDEGNVTKTVTTIKETICLRVRTVDTDGTIKTLE